MSRYVLVLTFKPKPGKFRLSPTYVQSIKRTWTINTTKSYYKTFFENLFQRKIFYWTAIKMKIKRSFWRWFPVVSIFIYFYWRLYYSYNFSSRPFYNRIVRNDLYSTVCSIIRWLCFKHNKNKLKNQKTQY